MCCVQWSLVSFFLAEDKDDQPIPSGAHGVRFAGYQYFPTNKYLLYDTIWYDVFNCNWVVTQWQ